MDPLQAISVPQPAFSEDQAKAVLSDDFELSGKLRPLVSERDQNFSVVTADQDRFVFKIANRSEPREATDFQIKALLHIEAKGCRVPTPRVRRNRNGGDAATIGEGGNLHVCRVVSFLSGNMFSGVDTTPELAGNLGESAAILDLALADFEHSGQAQSLLWDLQNASQLRDILSYIDAAELRSAAESCLDDFDSRIVPVLPELRRQVIHSDLHGDNVLVENNKIAGVIDFGDMLRAPLVMEVAVASAYLRPAADEPNLLLLVGPFIAAYHSVLPLFDDEIELLFDLIRARLVATIAILCWRTATRGADDAYSNQNQGGESDAEMYLLRLNSLGRDEFDSQLKKYIKNS
ncbi:MAG: phosphotransferase [Woeseiaceae bacterium]